MKKKYGYILYPVIVLSVSLIITQSIKYSEKSTIDNQQAVRQVTSEKPPQSKLRYGLPVDFFKIHDKIMGRGESFSDILLAYNVGYEVINKIANDFRDVFDVRYLRIGQPYSVFLSRDNSLKTAHYSAHYLVYESSPINYYVFNLKDSIRVYKGKREVTIKQKEVSGIIESSLYVSLLDRQATSELALKLSDIYAWTIDFFRIKKGDSYKVIYEEKFIDDTISIGIGDIIAAEFNHRGGSFFSFFYQKGEDYYDYFDEEGNTLRRAFLKAPLKFSRISSRYSLKRFHPVLKQWKPHLGTDYAAPHGTPIMATADGKIIAASYASDNGKYVKIKHNSTYNTQYLHMSRFAKDIRIGKMVKQGDVIGYVGSTGLATGPHVCYRFWKNGKQVDPYRQDLPKAEPIKPEYKNDYLIYMKDWKQKLDEIIIAEEQYTELHLASAKS